MSSPFPFPRGLGAGHPLCFHSVTRGACLQWGNFSSERTEFPEPMLIQKVVSTSWCAVRVKKDRLGVGCSQLD